MSLRGQDPNSGLRVRVEREQPFPGTQTRQVEPPGCVPRDLEADDETSAQIALNILIIQMGKFEPGGKVTCSRLYSEEVPKLGVEFK